jgi:hypothetical protein
MHSSGSRAWAAATYRLSVADGAGWRVDALASQLADPRSPRVRDRVPSVIRGLPAALPGNPESDVRTLDWLEPFLLWRSASAIRAAPGSGVPNTSSRDPPDRRAIDPTSQGAHGCHGIVRRTAGAAMKSDHTPIEASEAFARLGRIVLGDQPLGDILEQVVQIARHVLPTPTDASITLIAGDQPYTPAFTSDTALALDERQYETERGPCLDAAASGNLIAIPDMRVESRWPQFAATAASRGVLSSLSVPLPVQREVTGALNFYATITDAFKDETVDLAQTFAGHAAVAAANAHLYETTANLAEQMKQAMATRAVIEQAKGIIMRDRTCTPDEAFDALVRLSQEAHLKLRDVAQRLVDHVVEGK